MPLRSMRSFTELQQPKPRVGQVDRINGMPGYWNTHRKLSHHTFLVKAENCSFAFTAGCRGVSVQFDEVDGRGRVCAICDTILHARADEREMGVAVSRFDCLLHIVQFGAKFHLIVAVFRALRKQYVERPEELRQEIRPVVQAYREALVEISCCRMEGTK